MKEYVECGVVRHSNSPWRAPVVPVRKPDGSSRMCVDYRGLNAVTKADGCLMPRIDTILDSLGKSRIFNRLDALSGYLQILMCEEDVEKTAFGCRLGIF